MMNDFGAVLTVAETYLLSVDGAFSPIADKATNDYMAIIGYGKTTSNMQVKIVNMDLQAP